MIRIILIVQWSCQTDKVQNENDKQFLLKQHIPEVSAEFADEYCKAVTRRSFSEHTNMQRCSRKDLSIFFTHKASCSFQETGNLHCVALFAGYWVLSICIAKTI